MQKIPTVLEKIVARKLEEIEAHKQQRSLAELKKLIDQQSPVRGFVASLEKKIVSGQAGIIAEIKKASPSKGVIREDFYPAEIAISYEKRHVGHS